MCTLVHAFTSSRVDYCNAVCLLLLLQGRKPKGHASPKTLTCAHVHNNAVCAYNDEYVKSILKDITPATVSKLYCIVDSLR